MHELDDITGAIVDSALKIHKELGPGYWNRSLGDFLTPRDTHAETRS